MPWPTNIPKVAAAVALAGLALGCSRPGDRPKIPGGPRAANEATTAHPSEARPRARAVDLATHTADRRAADERLPDQHSADPQSGHHRTSSAVPTRAATTVSARLDEPSHEVPIAAAHVVVHVPVGVPVGGPVDIVWFLHGWSGCAPVLVESGPAPCLPNQRPVPGWGLGARLGDADSTAVLVVSQLALRQRSGHPGRFGENGFARRWLGAVLNGPLRRALAEAAGEELDPKLLENMRLGEVSLFAHSAGFETALAILQNGDLDGEITNVVLFDALYSRSDEFAEWVLANDRRRLVCLHVVDGVRRECARLAHAIRKGSKESIAEVDASRDDVLGAAIRAHRVVVGKSSVSHGRVPARHLGAVVRGLFATQARGLP